MSQVNEELINSLHEGLREVWNECESDTDRACFAFERGYWELLPENGVVLLKDYYNAVIDESDKFLLAETTHQLCHIYERGLMSRKEYREVGDYLLDKLITKSEQGLMAHANRSVDGYWKSIEDNPEAWVRLKSILEKHPNYAFGQKYLGYMRGEKPEDEEDIRKNYLNNPNMLFVTTTMVDVDGTLIQNEKLNGMLLYGIMQTSDDFAIYTGGNPESQKKVLLKAAAEKILEEFPSIKRIYTIDEILKVYSHNSEENDLIRSDLVKKIEEDNENTAIESMIEEKNDYGYALLNFIERLLINNGDTNKIMIYPKQCFEQDNICLAGEVYDDIQPKSQGIKSLFASSLNAFEITDNYVNIPSERKISAGQVFEMWQQKEQQKEKLKTKITKRQGVLEQRTEQKVSPSVEPTKHDSNSLGSLGPNGRGGR